MIFHIGIGFNEYYINIIDNIYNNIKLYIILSKNHSINWLFIIIIFIIHFYGYKIDMINTNTKPRLPNIIISIKMLFKLK